MKNMDLSHSFTGIVNPATFAVGPVAAAARGRWRQRLAHERLTRAGVPTSVVNPVEP